VHIPRSSCFKDAGGGDLLSNPANSLRTNTHWSAHSALSVLGTGRAAAAARHSDYICPDALTGVFYLTTTYQNLMPEHGYLFSCSCFITHFHIILPALLELPLRSRGVFFRPLIFHSPLPLFPQKTKRAGDTT